MSDDPVAEAKRVVEAYLDRSMARDVDGARRYMAPDCRIVFTGGREMAGPGDPPAFNAKRYGWVKKRFLRTDAVLNPETGDVHVWNTGHLYGEWPDGEAFDGNRYVDFFAVRDGLIVRTEVWNDSAEILLAKAGLAEAPL
ncbi:nuclear transport factor 2 family protein [Psychromarinibacter sp. C21-152]|uniref:Nuclear transport factor 2 family protein n=1 Tax=Psychromarinibacter sediminicola TaxID=3033385 RepID=A0AAE3NNI1_9RHOB|nr:nuclear transport factor 2 family protein [Psychromarinibacter sediminicola]MDF0601248.1 nuclear transport factor 2 family protein [Psychromarinibacter sediminicola]